MTQLVGDLTAALVVVPVDVSGNYVTIGGGTGNVISVNGHSGTVVLTSADVGAVPFSGSVVGDINFTASGSSSNIQMTAGSGVHLFAQGATFDMLNQLKGTSADGGFYRQSVVGFDVVNSTNIHLTTVGALALTGAPVSINGYSVSIFKANEAPTGAINNVNTAFVLANAPITDSLSLFKAGTYMCPSGVGFGNGDYSLSGSTIKFVSAPVSGNVILANYSYLA